MIICDFSEGNTPLNEAPKTLKGKPLHEWLLKNLKGRKRISVWEIDSDMRVCRTLMYLRKIGKVKFNKNYDYPYQGVTLKGEL